ncbi:hypothetical protein VA603_03510 [Stenotrophomonas sp. MH1]|uniref:HTH marR-type domain-containing protein n=1 Tax=Stenotrophomonas capsici TaxID=3110230 RepID=A0ABU5V0V5_9GAMM|nr:hypothetical protein [Stenotrophomonas sp. MH1]MEA5666602.1 hypothetical protein [Stenotrophomonas sp. MH1]
MNSDGTEFEALLIMTNRLLRGLEPRLRKVGLSSTGYLALQAINRKQRPLSRPPIRSDLARSIGTTPASMSVLIARLVRNGMVAERARNDQSFELSLTLKGKAVLKEASMIWKKAFQVTSSVLGDAMKDRLLKAVAKINLVNENDEREAAAKRIAKTFRGEYHAVKRHKETAKAALEKQREISQAQRRALDES